MRGVLRQRGWVCDGCGEPVRLDEHGVVEWLYPSGHATPPRGGYAVRIAHRRPHGPSGRDCRFWSREGDGPGAGSRPLTDFLGADGPTLLLRMLATGWVAAAEVEKLARLLRVPKSERVQGHLRHAADASVPDADGSPGGLRGKGWVCDACRLPVRRPEHAVVEWLDPPSQPGIPRRGYAVRIVHYRPHSPPGRDCRDRFVEDGGPGVGSRALPEFLGADGLTLLLGMMAAERLRVWEAEELFRRVWLPGYDLVKAHLQDAINDGVLGADCDPRFPKVEEIGKVLDWLGCEDGPHDGSAPA